MAFGDLSKGSLFHPDQLVYKRISVSFEELKSESVLIIDHPNEEKAVFLNIVERNFCHDVGVVQRRIVCLNAPNLFHSRKNPRWVHCNHVKKLASQFFLRLL